MGYSQAELLESMAVHYHATKQELPILEDGLESYKQGFYRKLDALFGKKQP